MLAASSNEILIKSGNKLPRKSTAPWQKTRKAAKAKTWMQASNKAVLNKYIQAVGVVGNLNPGYSDIEIAKVNLERDAIRVRYTRPRIMMSISTLKL